MTKIQTQYRPIFKQNTDLLQTRAHGNTDLLNYIVLIKADDPTSTCHTTLYNPLNVKTCVSAQTLINTVIYNLMFI